MSETNDLSTQLIRFEQEKNMTDNEVAFGSHISVERVHDIKSMSSEPTSEEEDLLTRFMKSNA